MCTKATRLAAAAAVCCLAIPVHTGVAQEVPSWAAKPTKPTGYVSPHQPHTKLADLKARHVGQADWREVAVDDRHLRGEYIASAPGTKVTKRFHPDTRTFWIVIDGQIRTEIEGQAPFVATKGSMIQVPRQTIYSMETVGDRPSLRFHVSVADARTMYPQDVEPPKMPGVDWIRVTLDRTPDKYEGDNRPHINLSEAAKAPKYRGGPFVRDTKTNATIIYGYEQNLSPIDPKDRGHYHPESAEFWLIMAGEIRYAIENVRVIIASEGDLVYAPRATFHLARFHGSGPSCRLAMSAYVDMAHLRDPD